MKFTKAFEKATKPKPKKEDPNPDKDLPEGAQRLTTKENNYASDLPGGNGVVLT